MKRTHFTISELSKSYGLSRGTLLYYDSIGLLKSSRRTSSNYRIYVASDLDRLRYIFELRELGISISKIKRLLTQNDSNPKTYFKERLSQISVEMKRLSQQQNLILTLLNENGKKTAHNLTKEKWVKILTNTGFTELDMWKWHQEFEKTAPEAHHEFLLSLGIKKNEIEKIRRRSKTTT